MATSKILPPTSALLALIFVDHVGERDAVGEQRVGIEIDLVLFYEAADRRDFRNPFYRRKGVTQIPILNGAQLRQVMFAGIIDQRVLVDPAHACGVGSDHRIHAFRQRAAHRIQIFNDARPRPIDVRAVLKDDVDERFSEHRFAADEFHFRRGDEHGRNRISDLVFDQVGRAAFPIGVNDHLDVAEVGNGIERCVLSMPRSRPRRRRSRR